MVVDMLKIEKQIEKKHFELKTIKLVRFGIKLFETRQLLNWDFILV